ncbi:hypothetical protein [Lichenifustis flavocetrariae]|uniref:Uncharacterized protein n=1 Tax=Lichenifustis flavocetrariae TaxID=2949735 RepID=A0AA42CMQ7_9HYPH|nr:hypothetical protein [Lichenifustis flavocetrariae]MCW6512949.1 hypothetical protein [Lichenifustis flavocetrariae]
MLEKNGWTIQEAGNEAEAVEPVTPAPLHPDPARPHDAGHGRLRLPAPSPGEAGWCGHPGDRPGRKQRLPRRNERFAEADQVLRKDETSIRDPAAEARRLDKRHAPNPAAGA